MKKQSGQTLIFILLIMTIALAVGVSISSRTISTVRRTTNVDTSSRALSAAEAGAEYYLSKTSADLDAIIDSSDPTDCSPVTSARYPDPDIADSLSTDGVETYAQVEISHYGCFDSTLPVSTEKYQIKEGGVLEIKLDQSAAGNIFSVCWKKPIIITQPTSQLYTSYYYENSSGVPQITKKGYKIDNTGSSSNNFTSAAFYSTARGYCFDQTLSSGTVPKLLRILSLYNSSDVTLYMDNETPIQYQGYKIVSTGHVGSATQGVKRTVTAKRSLPYLPAIFNFEVFSNTGSL